MAKYVGYARVSSAGQSLAIQLEKLNSIPCHRIFQEKESGTKDDRPELLRCLDYVREEDTFIVTRIDRLARSTLHLCQIAERLKKEGVALRILDQQIDTSTPSGVLHFQMLGAIAEFETALRRERQTEGIRAAQAKGVHFGRGKSLTSAQVAELCQLKAAGVSVPDLVKQYGLTRASIYRYLAEGRRLLGVPAEEPEAEAAD